MSTFLIIRIISKQTNQRSLKSTNLWHSNCLLFIDTIVASGWQITSRFQAPKTPPDIGTTANDYMRKTAVRLQYLLGL